MKCLDFQTIILRFFGLVSYHRRRLSHCYGEATVFAYSKLNVGWLELVYREQQFQSKKHLLLRWHRVDGGCHSLFAF